MDLACPGETTATMLGTPAVVTCGALYNAEFSDRSQITAAETFLARHPGRVALVTLDIGANDVDTCISATKVNATCLEANDVAAIKNLGTILGALTRAVHRYDPTARVAGMNYLDSFLGLAFSPGGTSGTEAATASVAATNAFNVELSTIFHKFGAKVADVASAFHIDDVLPLSKYDGKTLPADVVMTCQLTWMCPVVAGKAQDIHPNAAGYRTIAAAFTKVLGG
jgi:lysophospholipase L1-like esterase